MELFWKIVFNLGILATIVAQNTHYVRHLCRVSSLTLTQSGRHEHFRVVRKSDGPYISLERTQNGLVTTTHVQTRLKKGKGTKNIPAEKGQEKVAIFRSRERSFHVQLRLTAETRMPCLPLL